MRDFRDAKAMAQTLRQSLTAKSVTVSRSESLELVSKMLGAADWNTLSALIRSGRREAAPAEAVRPEQPGRYPAIPLRDLVPFPAATYPIFIGRQKTVRALDLAGEHARSRPGGRHHRHQFDGAAAGETGAIGDARSGGAAGEGRCHARSHSLERRRFGAAKSHPITGAASFSNARILRRSRNRVCT